MRILVLGAYGQIGLAVARRLLQDGHEVTGLARSATRGEALLPQADWIGADLGRLTGPALWQSHLQGIDVVVNAAGVLQNGARDKVQAVQEEAISALIDACEAQSISRFVQISAPGAVAEATTEFYRTKAAADRKLAGSSLEGVILRPGLVIGPAAYGGTALVRMLAAMPVVQPLALADARIQTVALAQVAEAVALSVTPAIAPGDYDLVEEAPQTLGGIVGGFRHWLGFAPARWPLHVPLFLGQAAARFGDIAGWFGWRPALRTTSLKVLGDGVIGDPGPWQEVSGMQMMSFHQALATLPATVQERLYARMHLLFPLLLLVLALFWLASGIIGLIQLDRAAALLTPVLSQPLARVMVIGGAVADIAIALFLLWRPWLRAACVAAILVSLAYLVGGSLLRPDLWADPLGPLVKVVPAMALALVVMGLVEER